MSRTTLRGAQSSSGIPGPWNIVKLYAVRPSGSPTTRVGNTAIWSRSGPAYMSTTPVSGSASIATLAGVAQQESGLASGLNNTSFQIGSALGVAILSTVAVPALGLLVALVLLGRVPGRLSVAAEPAAARPIS